MLRAVYDRERGQATGSDIDRQKKERKEKKKGTNVFVRARVYVAFLLQICIPLSLISLLRLPSSSSLAFLCYARFFLSLS